MTKTKLQVMREKKSEGKMIKFEVVEADVIENTITLDAGDYFKNGQIITLNEKMILLESKPDIPINKYEEDLAKASEILNKAHLPKIIDIAVNAIDDAIVDIDMEAEQEWHAKITLESSLIEIAEQTLCDDFLTEEHEFDNYLGKLALNLGYKFVTDFIVDLKRNGFVRESQTNTGMRIIK